MAPSHPPVIPGIVADNSAKTRERHRNGNVAESSLTLKTNASVVQNMKKKVGYRKQIARQLRGRQCKNLPHI